MNAFATFNIMCVFSILVYRNCCLCMQSQTFGCIISQAMSQKLVPHYFGLYTRFAFVMYVCVAARCVCSIVGDTAALASCVCSFCCDYLRSATRTKTSVCSLTPCWFVQREKRCFLMFDACPLQLLDSLIVSAAFSIETKTR